MTVFVDVTHDEKIGTHLRLIRLRLGLSQTALAAALNVSREQVAEFERGSTRIGGQQLVGISIILGTPIRDLLLGGTTDA